MQFGLRWEVGVFVHFVGPDRRVQLESASDGDNFLAVRHAMCAHDARHGDALGLAQICFGQFRAATGTTWRRCHSEGHVVRVPKNLIVGCTPVAPRLRSFAIAQDEIWLGGWRCNSGPRFLATLRANVNIFAERNLYGFPDI